MGEKIIDSSVNAKDSFKSVIIKFKEKTINLIRPGGHYGDLLIYLGLEKLLKSIGVSYRIFRYVEKYSFPFRAYRWGVRKFTEVILHNKEKQDSITNTICSPFYHYYIKGRWRAQFNDNSIILIGGGGNINDFWFHGIRLLKLLINQNRDSTIIVAPQSYYFRITNFPSIFKEFEGEAYLFCREKYSYKLLSKMKLPTNVKVILSHDTAFYLSREDFPKGSPKHDLLCFRQDKESIITEKVKNVVRKIAENPLELDVATKAKNFNEFVSAITNSKNVYTDRLHVAILAAILKKQVFLFPNKYWKNKGVFEYSLKKYKNVTFIMHPKNFLRTK